LVVFFIEKSPRRSARFDVGGFHRVVLAFPGRELHKS
jgi:hypothetical protein